MASVTAVRNGLKDRLATITSPAWETYARAPDDVVVPCAIVMPAKPAIEFDSTMQRGSDELFFIITVLVGASNDELAQSNLDPYLAGSGAQSVKAAVEGDATLGATVSYARVARVLDYGEVDYAGNRYLGALFFVEVIT